MPWVVTIAACVVTVGLLVRMVIAGFVTRRDVVFSWPMFAEASYCYFELTADTSSGPTNVNFWDYAISADLSLTEAGARRFLRYLREFKSLHAQGRVVIDDAWGPDEMKVVDGYLVD